MSHLDDLKEKRKLERDSPCAYLLQSRYNRLCAVETSSPLPPSVIYGKPLRVA